MTANIISAIALPHEVFLTDKFFPERINIIYGRNGTGKTTIAKELFPDA
jgi:AAA15 family ATPase/GTPase